MELFAGARGFTRRLAASSLLFPATPVLLPPGCNKMPAMDGKPTRLQEGWWTWSVLIWAGLGLFEATKNVYLMRAEGMHHAWVALFITLFVARLPWIPMTVLVVNLGRRYPFRFIRLTPWLVHLSVAIGIALINSALFAGLEKLLNPWTFSADAGPFMGLWKDSFYGGFLEVFFFYAAILGADHIIESRSRLLHEEAEKANLSEQLAKAQLSALRRQIEPHFLFNTLNSIAAQVRDGMNDAAVNMIAALSDVLRAVVADSNRQEVPLGDEVELLQKYLDIQKARFAERLQVSLQIPVDLSSAMVPGFILQPMVENAIQHGIAKRVRGGALQVTAAQGNGFVTLSVYNDGPTLPANWQQDSSGVGLSNLRSRLRGLYGEDHRFSIRNRNTSGVEVSISVPFHKG